MWEFADLHGIKPTPALKSNTIYEYIRCSSDFSKFKKVVDNANMEGVLNDCEANFTLFLPKDSSLTHIPDEFFDTMDAGTAKQILKASLLDDKINKKILVSSPVCYYATLNPKMRMYCTNIGGYTRLNNCATVKEFDINRKGGLIHIVDNILVPTEDHFMN